MRKQLFILAAATFAVVALTGVSQAASVVFNNQVAANTGTGSGVNIGVLSLAQQSPNFPDDEWGFTGYNPGAGDAAGPYTAAQTQKVGNLTFGSASYTGGTQVGIGANPSDYFARNTGFLASQGITTDNFALIFQVNEGNGSLEVDQFNVNFYNPDGTIQFTARFPTPQVDANLLLAGTGQGTAGWLFPIIDFSVAEKAWYDTGLGYIGIDVKLAKTITSVDSGADNFLFGTTAAVVPVPAAAWTGLSVLAGLGIFGKLRKRLVRD